MSEKRCRFCLKLNKINVSIIDVKKMSTSLHAISNVVFDKVYFVKVIPIIWGPKMRFPEGSPNSTSEKLIFCQFEVIFSTFKLFPWRWGLFPVSAFQEKSFDKKMSSPAGLKKSYSIFRKSINFGHFSLSGFTFRVNFLNVNAKFQTIHGQFPGGGC